jgi:hypothetical protein
VEDFAKPRAGEDQKTDRHRRVTVADLDEVRGLSIFPTRREICAQIFVHLLLIAVPPPATVLMDGNVGTGIKLEALKFFSCARFLPVDRISVPEMEYVHIQKRRLSAHGCVVRLGPGDIPLSFLLVHAVTVNQLFQAVVSGASHCAASTAEDASIKEKVPVQQFATRRPRKARC